MRFTALVLTLLYAVATQAEYRVFELKITDTKTKKSRTVHSTLDWLQYQDYHYLGPNEIVQLADTWMCWKRHKAYTPLCKRPVTEKSLREDFENGESE